jgi:hypothetical protein
VERADSKPTWVMNDIQEVTQHLRAGERLNG